MMALAAPALAQEEAAAPPAAVPVQAVEAQKLDAPVVLELFSSQACVFCPRADTLFGDLVQNDHVIGLACHIDYFNVRRNSLAWTFCTKRQSAYGKKLRTGPGYTPQMIVDGLYDVIGYHFEDILETMRRASKQAPAPIIIKALEKKNIYEISLPGLDEAAISSLEMVFFDKPHAVKIAGGANRGKSVTYHNIVSRIDPMMEWDGQTRTLRIKVVLAGSHKGFAILAPDAVTGQILAAGQYKRPLETAGPPRRQP